MHVDVGHSVLPSQRVRYRCCPPIRVAQQYFGSHSPGEIHRVRDRTSYSLARAPWVSAPVEQTARFRFWHDEKRFKGTGDTSLAQIALLASGGTRTGGNFKAAPLPGPLGWQRPEEWDLLWSPADTAVKAASKLRPGQLICGVPGLRCITNKKKLPSTLAAAYGEGAWSMVPTTFSLPSQLRQWREALAQEANALAATAAAAGTAAAAPASPQAGGGSEPQQPGPVRDIQDLEQATSAATDADCSPSSSSSSSTIGVSSRAQSSSTAGAAAGRSRIGAAGAAVPQGLWVLKTQEHLGQGLLVVPGRSALRLMLERNQHRVKQQLRERGLLPAVGAEGSLDEEAGPTMGEAAAGSDGRDIEASTSATGNGSKITGAAAVLPEDAAQGAGSTAREQAVLPEDAAQGTGSTAREQAVLPEEAGQGTSSAGKANSRKLPQSFVAAQRYVTDPLLLLGRKFGIRVWVVVMGGGGPLRAYLHQNGLVLFSSEEYEAAEWRGEDGGVALGHVTNYAQNQDGLVWRLAKLQLHLGQQQWDQLWYQMSTSAAKTVAAALPAMREAAQELQLPDNSCCELLGLDFLVDVHLHPWLLEVNATPSLAWEHSQPELQEIMREQKAGMVADLMGLLRLQDRFPLGLSPEGAGQGGGQAGPGQRVEAAGQREEAAPWWRSGKCMVSQGYLQVPERVPVLQQVREAAARIKATADAGPTRAQVEQQVQQLLLCQLQREQPAKGGGVGTCGGAASGPGAGCCGKEEVEGLQQGVVLKDHQEHLVQLEGELQSLGGWQLLNGHFPYPDDLTQGQEDGGCGQGAIDPVAVKLPWSDADVMVSQYLKLRAN